MLDHPASVNRWFPNTFNVSDKPKHTWEPERTCSISSPLKVSHNVGHKKKWILSLSSQIVFHCRLDFIIAFIPFPFAPSHFVLSEGWHTNNPRRLFNSEWKDGRCFSFIFPLSVVNQQICTQSSHEWVIIIIMISQCFKRAAPNEKWIIIALQML